MTVKAAGGVVVRAGDAGREVLLVHRQRHDDWSFPKGKLDRGESFEDAAVREVEEETGLRCALVRELPSSRYRDDRGRAKVVRWWLMQPRSGSFQPNDEVDAIRWLAPREAREALTYDGDRELLESALEQ